MKHDGHKRVFFLVVVVVVGDEVFAAVCHSHMDAGVERRCLSSPPSLPAIR